jgi:hypothetical protein
MPDVSSTLMDFLAARNRVVVVTTLGEAIRWTFDEKDKTPEARIAVRVMLAGDLQILQKHGVFPEFDRSRPEATPEPTEH